MAATPPPPPGPPPPNNCQTPCSSCPPFPVPANTTVSTPSNSVANQAKSLWDGLFQQIWNELKNTATIEIGGAALATSAMSKEKPFAQSITLMTGVTVNSWGGITGALASAFLCSIPKFLADDPEHNKGKGCLCNSGLAMYNFYQGFWGNLASAFNGAPGWLVSQACLDGKTWPPFDIQKPKKCPDGFKTTGKQDCVVTGCYIPQKSKAIQTINKALDVVNTVASKMVTSINWQNGDRQKINSTPPWAAPKKNTTLHGNWSAIPSSALVCFDLIRFAKQKLAVGMKSYIENFKSRPRNNELQNIVNSFYSQYKAKIDEFSVGVARSCAGCGGGKGHVCTIVNQRYQSYTAVDVWNIIHAAVGAYDVPFPNTVNDVIGYSQKFWTQSAVKARIDEIGELWKTFYTNSLNTATQVLNFVYSVKASLNVWKSLISGHPDKCDCYSFLKETGNEKGEMRPCCPSSPPPPPPNLCYHGCKIPVIKQLNTSVACPFPSGQCSWSPNIYGEDSAGSSSTPASLTMWANDIAGHAVLGGGYTAFPSGNY